jgi:hypothetical protein
VILTALKTWLRNFVLAWSVWLAEMRVAQRRGLLAGEPISLTAILVSTAISAGASYGSFLLSAHLQSRRNKKNPIDKGRNDDLRIQTSEYGNSIPIIKGRGRVAGNIIDTSSIQVTTTTTQGRRVKKVRQPDTVNFSYSVWMHILLCEGPVADIRRMWLGTDLVFDKNADGSGGGGDGGGGGGADDGGAGGGRKVIGLINTAATYPTDPNNPADFYHVAPTSTSDTVEGTFADGSWVFYKGTATQGQDSNAVAMRGAASTPAYRHRCSLAINLRLKDGFIPNITVEVDQGDSEVATIITDLYALNGLTSAELDVTALSSDEVDGLLVPQRKQLKDPVEAELGTVCAFDMVDVDGKLKAVKRSGASVATITASELGAIEVGEGESDEPPVDAVIEDAEEVTLPSVVEVGYIDTTAGADFHHNVQSARVSDGNTQDSSNPNFAVAMTPSRARQLAEQLLHRAHTERSTVKFQTGWEYLKLHPNDVVTLSLDDGISLVVRITQMNAALPAGVVKFEGVVQDVLLFTQGAAGASGSGLEEPVVAFAGNQKLVVFESGPLRYEHDRLLAYAGSCLRGDGTNRGAFLYRASPSGEYDEVETVFTEQSTIGVTASALQPAEPQTFDSVSSLLIDFFNGAPTAATQAQLLADPYLNLIYVANPAGGELMQFTTPTPATTAFTADAGTDVCTSAAHGYSNGWAGTVSSTGTLPGGLTSGQTVFLRDVTANTFKVAATSGGAAINLTSAGTGVHSFALAWPYTAGRYRVSGLLRGLFGTEAAVSHHAAGQDVLLVDWTVKAVSLEVGDVGRTLSFKSVSAGQRVADAEAVELDVTGRSLSPPAAVHLTGTRNSDNDLLVEWTRRGRRNTHLRDFAGEPLSEESEVYELEILDAAGDPLDPPRVFDVRPPYLTDAVLESDSSNSKYDQITGGNTCSGAGSGAGTTVQFASLQRITGPGNFVDATLTSETTFGTGVASVGILDAATEWRRQSVSALIRISVTNDGAGTTTTTIAGPAGTLYTSTAHANGSRWTIEVLREGFRVYRDYKGRASVPVYVSASAPSAFPVRAYGIARTTGSSVADVRMTTTPEPKAAYLAEMQTADGFAPGDPVRVRVRQLSAVTGYGEELAGTV